jgi:segregation and condensation protein A
LETIGYYFKEPDKDISQYKIVYKDFNVNAMLEAFAQLLLRNESMQREKDNVKEIPKDEYTVEEKVDFIRQKLLTDTEFEFDSLFTTYSKNEVITTFQALLEMLKYQYICVEQSEAFGSIKIKANPETDLRGVTSEQFDEYN